MGGLKGVKQWLTTGHHLPNMWVNMSCLMVNDNITEFSQKNRTHFPDITLTPCSQISQPKETNIQTNTKLSKILMNLSCTHLLYLLVHQTIHSFDTIRHFGMTDRTLVVLVNHCFTSRLGTNDILSDIVIR